MSALDELRIKSILETIRNLVGKVPCELCGIKGGSNIELDGGCRHRPITDQEIVNRLTRLITKYRNII